MKEEPQPPSRDVKRGLMLGFAMNACYVALCLLWRVTRKHAPTEVDNLFDVLVLASLFYIAVTQLIYVLPAIAYYRFKQRPKVIDGLLIAAFLMLVLNVLGWFLFNASL